MSQLEVFFRDLSEEWAEVVIAELNEKGYESFWQDEDGLRAYVSKAIFQVEVLVELAHKYADLVTMTYAINETLPGKWERGMESTTSFVIADRIFVKSNASETNSETSYDLFLDAQMAFGSGKHPSTQLCMTLMLELNFNQSRVLDIGTGSGVLAMLAEKLGAQKVDGFDNNPWAVDVAQSLLVKNNISNVALFENDIDGWLAKGRKYTIVLANLNYDVLASELQKLPKFLDNNGQLLISGFMKKDREQLLVMIEQLGLIVSQELELESWLVLLLVRQNSQKKKIEKHK